MAFSSTPIDDGVPEYLGTLKMELGTWDATSVTTGIVVASGLRDIKFASFQYTSSTTPTEITVDLTTPTQCTAANIESGAAGVYQLIGY